MLAFVDIQHPRIAEDPEKGPVHRRLREHQSRRIAEATGVPCELIRYTQLDAERLRQDGVRGIMISGCAFDWAEYDWPTFAPLQEIVRDGELPVLGFCGGHQLMAMTLGGSCAPLGPLPPGMPDPDPSIVPGLQKESGVMPVRIVRDDPLLAGLPATFTVLESHYWEVTRLPEGFERLAETDVCSVQMMRHRERPWAGTQFHPERYEAEFPAGAQILRNFCETYGVT
jgi:GMP synthase (glutamine-hydrolysing)